MLPQKRLFRGHLTLKGFVLAIIVMMILLQSKAQAESESLLDYLGLEVHGFIDARFGTRIEHDPNEKDTILSEARLQTDITRSDDWGSIEVRADFLYDGVADNRDLDLKGTKSPLDLREANLLFYPFSFMDVKAGRQILTWGTGDLLFINDLFPKDWQSFFIGRDEEYLKAPSDAFFISIFPGFANIDIAYTPRFDPDRYVRGERLSLWNPMLGKRTGHRDVIHVREPGAWFDDDETALRMSRNFRGYELALYGYYGFWKNPIGMDPNTKQAIFPKLMSYGGSVRTPLLKGLFNLEVGRYVSINDRNGEDPLVPNSEMRFLIGYEKELARDFTAKFQYYQEFMEDYHSYKHSLLMGEKARDEDRHLFTLRLTKLALNQNLTLCLFTYYSPSDQDAYARSLIKYKFTDELGVTVGGNLFRGKNDYTFFGQFEKSSNIYGAIRYSY